MCAHSSHRLWWNIRSTSSTFQRGIISHYARSKQEIGRNRNYDILCCTQRQYQNHGFKEDQDDRSWSKTTTDQKHEHEMQQRTHNYKRNHRNPTHSQSGKKFHSTRLVSESAARRTTQLFLEKYQNRGNGGSGDDDDNLLHTAKPPQPCTDEANILAAEHALEFWANRNNNSVGNRNHATMHLRMSPSSTQQIEHDANLAHSLFVALEHFHSYIGSSRKDSILTNGMYSHVIDALAKSPNLEHIQLADAYLRRFIELYLLHNMQHNLAHESPVIQILNQIRNPIHPSAMVTTAVENNETNTFILPKKDQLIHTIQWNRTDKHHFPNQVRITGVMRGYARHSIPRAAEALLDIMRDLSSCHILKSDQSIHIFRPNAMGYATVIDAYSRVHDGINAERILRLMGTEANVVAYNTAISAWARSSKLLSNVESKNVPNRMTISSSLQAAENAERLLREMWNGKRRHHADHRVEHSHKICLRGTTLVPDVVTYSTVISAYATCLDQPLGLKRAHELLNELEGLASREFEESQRSIKCETPNLKNFSTDEGRNPHGFQPNASVYNTILQAYAKAGDATSAESILESMILLNLSSLKNGGSGPFQYVRPNTRTFNVVLNAVAKSDGISAGTRARKILNRLESMMKSCGDDGPRPDIITYNTVLAAWSKSASVDSNTSNKNMEKAEECVVGKHAAYEALKLLESIEERQMKSFERTDNNHRHDVIKPDVISYNTTIAAFANAAQRCDNGVSMAEKAEEILLTRMVNMGVQPDSYSYNGVLLAWSRSSGGMTAAKRAETILRTMKVTPTIISWSTVVNAYAHADGARYAEALLREMEENVIATPTCIVASSQNTNQSFHTHPIVPSIIIYNNVLQSWARSSEENASKNAELLLHRMLESSHLPSPDVISYGIVLNALEHTLDGDKATRARSVLNQMISSHIEKTLFIKPHEILNAFNSVLTACAYTPSDAGEYHRSNAARILVETLRDINHFPWLGENGERKNNDTTMSCGPNQETYLYFIQGCLHLFDPSSKERDALLELAYRECCKKGLDNAKIRELIAKSIGMQEENEIVE